MLCLFGLNAQQEKKPDGSADAQKRDSIVLKRVDSEMMFRRKFAEIDSSTFNTQQIKKQLKAFYSDYRQWRFGLNGGIEMIIAPEPAHIPEELLKYRKSLKSGMRFGADAMFFVSPNIGLGVNYSTYIAHNKTNYLAYELNNNQYEGARQDNIRIHFIGPTLSIRSIPKHNKIYASCDFIIGYFSYSNDLIFNNVSHHLNRSNFGFATSVGSDFMFMKNMSLGVSLNITAASIKNIETVSENKTENLSRVSLVMTLRTYK
jgi:opacity protein-like surface antigen